LKKACISILLWFGNGSLYAGGGGNIDHLLHKDDKGVWQLNYELPTALAGGMIADAIWEGNDSRLGKTMWQSVDALAISGVVTVSLKQVTTRVRPSETNNPGLWFQGGKNFSFPSGHTSSVAAMVTPFILEYHDDNLETYALAVLPIYEAVARVKAQAHWQTDVLAGTVVGVTSGYFAHQLETPLIFTVLPHGVYVGLNKQF
jgi:undecaprenyl-diphosphatase